MDVRQFDYNQAVNRNIGWLTAEEQESLHRSKVAIAGMGGAGGHQAECLTRLGVTHFKIADPDTFELSNFNRQVGSSTLTLGQPKTAVMQALIESINPEAVVHTFPGGITPENIDHFLEDVAVVIDGVDFFALETKLLLFEKAAAKGIPLVTSCPIGFGASVIVFAPQGMSYKKYFNLREGMSTMDKMYALGFGLSPSPLCLSYMNRQSLNFSSGRAASVCPGLMLVGGLACSEAVKIITGKGAVKYCPHVFQVDLFSQKVNKKYYPMGMASPLMKMKLWLLRKFVMKNKMSGAS